jgi:hypothetical protein
VEHAPFSASNGFGPGIILDLRSKVSAESQRSGSSPAHPSGLPAASDEY